MLCKVCRRLLVPGAQACVSCGAPLYESRPPLELVLGDGTRVPILGSMVVGRAADCGIRIDDSTISRHHARVWHDIAGAHIEDVGSSYGTCVDGTIIDAPTPLNDGSTVKLGDVVVRAERRRLDEEAGRTIVVRAGESVLLPKVGAANVDEGATTYGFHPRVRSGWALKRMPASEGERRWVLKDLERGDFMRMGDDDAALFQMLDGRRSLPELVAEAEKRFGDSGTARLASMLAGLAEHELLDGTESEGVAEVLLPRGRLAKIFAPRTKVIEGASAFFSRIYEAGAYLLFTRAAAAVVVAISVIGAAAYAYLVFGRYGTPFVVAKKIGLGGLVFLVGRFVVVAFHELAHGLLLTAYGRRVDRAGLKLFLIFPYVFVDTSDAWFEPRDRRVAVSAAGPVSDFTVGGAFAIGAAFAGSGTIREILFQVAFAAYLGAIFNLNPFLDRDGYNMLVDWLGKPGLRHRARVWMTAKLSGKPTQGDDRAVAIYSIFAVVWSFVAVAFGVVMSLRYYHELQALVPKEALWSVFGIFYVLIFLPVLATFVKPIMLRRRARQSAEVPDAAA